MLRFEDRTAELGLDPPTSDPLTVLDTLDTNEPVSVSLPINGSLTQSTLSSIASSVQVYPLSEDSVQDDEDEEEEAEEEEVDDALGGAICFLTGCCGDCATPGGVTDDDVYDELLSPLSVSSLLLVPLLLLPE